MSAVANPVQPTTSATPLTILTGFLGAGKTTLLNRILSGDHGLRVGVLVNDFGAINIDADLIVGVQDGMVSLTNGCVCCQIRDDLTQAVLHLLNQDNPVEYVILEASGVAEPSAIAFTFVDEALRDRIRLDSITCVVDAEQVFANADQPALVRLKMMQIACADMMVLNKVDLAGPAQVAKVYAWIDEHFGRLRVVMATRCNVPLEILLGAGRFDPIRQLGQATCGLLACTDAEHAHAHHRGHDHGEMFATWSFETDRPMRLDLLREMIRRELPGPVYRCKGIIHTVESPELRAVLQVVGRRVDVTLADAWGERLPGTRIVAIGVPDALDPQQLRTLFERCLLPENAVA